ncbi:type II toxin-antitoxin system PrlF family antitoxin [Ectothiorhodospira haloalkaliphila]|uniref:type II toxin-antitoxin system PrlF family antitoxin n=1 Tax=Ectothiorhodospira TaxID=1051 RepID=UPI001EE829E5|nr:MULTISPECIES: type II toxin-antitoxin system PrlF family antitoxin [Ectothiorhodospira]MCG5496981.1 type II toxin-antitoxin system PrlF family antitoxin [Ectothiorhodospira variabilis]MCG5525124.1 type II toxin-antitoxin system PrlF family antitoxin [Ectothiorhodospira haloalkaliphila]
MNTTIEADSTLTDRYQTTVPATVRHALKLKRRDRIHYTIRPNGEVVLSRASDESSRDPVMTSFLAFLERDLQEHPENIQAVTASTFAEAERLTSGVEVDMDEVLPEDDDDA